jgi:Family of unknown function (DUF6491)
MRRFIVAGLAAAAAVVALGAPVASQAATTTAERACINMHRTSSWKAVDDKTLYISQSKSDVYRVDFASGCSRMDDPFTKFVSVQRTPSVCAPIDLDIKVFSSPGFTNTCIATGLHKLTAEEIAALPPTVKY